MNKNISASLENDPIILHFQDAHKRIFGKSIYVRGDKEKARFITLGRKLRKEGISTADYADNCMILAKDWAKRNGFKTIPLNLMTGNWLYDKYIKLKSKTSVKLEHKDDGKSEDVLYIDERIVATEYLRQRLGDSPRIRLMDVVEQLEDVLSDEWKSLFYDSKLRKYELDVLQEMEVKYNTSASSYKTLAEYLRQNGYNS